MTINVDLFTIANAGVSASNNLLSTTGRNISNVNTEGYVRQETSFLSSQHGGVGRAVTERVINQFATNQLRRDTTTVGELTQFNQNTAALDQLLANEANSVTAGMSDLFNALETAADDPTNLPSRDLVLGRTQTLVGRVQGIADYMQDVERELNLAFQSEVNKANSLIENIAGLNTAISMSAGNGVVSDPNILMNQRDLAVLELSAIMGIQVRESANNTINVSLSSGESVVMDNGSFGVLQMGSDPDSTFQVLELKTKFGEDVAKFDTAINVKESNLGGSLGGLFRYRNEVLAPAQRELGQTMVALADNMNQQNQMGMDLDGQLGSELFTIPQFNGLNYRANNDLTSQANGRIGVGQSHLLTDSDYRVTVLSTPSAAAPPTFDIRVEALNADGTATRDQSNTPIEQTFTVTAEAGTFNTILGGIELEFASGDNYSVDDQFLFQPTRRAAAEIELATQRPEDLALASPLRVMPGADNRGSVSIVSLEVTNTRTNTDTGPLSAFNPDNSLDNAAQSPAAGVGAPTQIVFNSDTTYQVLDAANNVISTVNAPADLQNLFAHAKDNGAPAWPAAFDNIEDYPGYELSLQGVPKAGDTFNIEFNVNGFNDNENALKLADLQDKGTIKISNNDTGTLGTFHENYANMVGRIGEQAGRSEISLEAATVMQEQSRDFFDSVSGVNLDEEAANLIRFQQAYAASARIISTAQSLFDTILQMVR